MKERFLYILKDDKGQVLPLVAIMLMIILMFASVAIGSTLAFKERKEVQDVIDAALLSALLATSEQREAPTKYEERTVGSERVCGVCYYTDEDGNTYSEVRCTYSRYDHYIVEKDFKNYIYVNPSQFEDVFRTYFNLNNRNAELKNIDLKFVYDDERYLTIIKNLPNLHTPDSSRPASICGTSYTLRHYYHIENPPAWWRNEFSGTNLTLPIAWTELTYETRSGGGSRGAVPFPRWVEVTANVTVEVSSFMGSFVGGKDSYEINVTSVAFQEVGSLEG